MDFAQYWYGPSDGEAPGFSIENSLRFRNDSFPPTASLENENIQIQTNSTFSGWIKIGGPGTNVRGFIFGGSREGIATSSTTVVGWRDDSQTFYSRNTVDQNANYSDAARRDFSAWYHLVVQMNATGNMTLFVNGEQQPNVLDPIDTSSHIIIGRNRTDSDDEGFQGYMADLYYIDGQVLEPTAFGSYNDNGVWVPREVDFTPATMRFSDFLFTSTNTSINVNSTDRNFANASGPEFAFNGNLGLATNTTATTNSAIVFRPTPALTGVTQIEVNYSAAVAGTVAGFNGGNEANAAAAGWNEVYNGAAVDVNNIYIRNAAQSFLAGIRITDGDGTRVLTNPFIYSAGMASNPASPALNYLPAASRIATDNPGNAFDGSEATFCSTPGQRKRIYWTAPTQLKNVTTLRVNNNTGQMQNLFINGVDTGFTSTTGPGWIDISAQIPADGIITEISFHTSVTNNTTRIAAIEVNGQVYVDGQNPSYGTNGFHLTFADPDDLGHDSSGNGNDFTATGFDTAPIGIFSDAIQGSGNTYESNEASRTTSVLNRTATFDGTTPTGGSQIDSNPVGWFYLPYDFSGVTNLKVDMYFAQATGSLRINGNAVAYTRTSIGSSLYQLEVTSPPSDITEIALIADRPNTQVCRIFVNNTELVDNSGEDYDLMQDSPTQNYATLNPLDPFASATIDANLGITAGAAREFAPGTIAMADNRFYVELNCDQPPVNPPNRQYIVYIVPSSGVDNSTPSASTGAYEVKINSGTNFTVGTNGSPVVAGTLSSAPGANFTMQVLYNAGTRGLYCSIDNANWLRNDGTISTAFDESEPTIVLPEPASGSYTIGCNIYNGTGNINYGQQPFVYTPPTGFEKLQTQNLPAATIADGRDHFQAITGPGQGADNGVAGQLAGNWSKDITIGDGNSWYNMSAAAIFDGTNTTAAGVTHPASGGTNGQFSFIYWNPEGGLDFTDTVEVWSNNSTPSSFTFNGGPQQTVAAGQWVEIASGGGTINNITCRNQLPNNSVAWWSGIRVDGNVLVDASILAIAQQTFPNGLWWVKNRASASQHQLVDSVRGGNLAMTTPSTGSESTYSTPVGDCVAWCWKAGGAAVANTNGSIASQVSANTDAGFSIVTYTGNGTSVSTVGHGLSEPLDLIMIKSRTNTDNWRVYSSPTGPGEYLCLNSTANSTPNANIWDNTAPTKQVFTIGAGQQVNNAQDYVAYCWHSVPGYSAFGSYTGNGSSTDGAFVYTGFAVQFVMVKRTDSATNWVLYDTTRTPTNPSDDYLYANLTSGEGTSASFSFDLLSNGFKVRGNSANINANNGNYIYCAFASNPFQSPVTAR